MKDYHDMSNDILNDFLIRKKNKLTFLKSIQVIGLFSISNKEEKIIKLKNEIKTIEQILKNRENNKRGVSRWI